MKKLKILMLGWEYPPYITGGLGTHCDYLTKALSKLPVKTYFVTPHPIHKKIGNLEIVGLDISQKFKEDGKILSYGKFKKEKVKLYTKKISEILDKYEFDIIHSQDWPPIEAAIKLKKLSKKPLIQTIHSTEFDKTKRPKKRSIALEKKGMMAANRVIAVSNFTKKIIINKYKIDSRKISVIYNAIEKKKAPPKKKIGKIKYILYLGRIKYQKGLPFLIDAVNIVLKEEKNIKILVVGKGKHKDVAKLKRKISKLGLTDKIKFLGYVKDKEYYYRKAYLFVMPSVSEPFGITPLESIHNGTPALISKQSGVSEVLKSCLKFDYWDTEDLAKKILFLIRNKKAYDKLRSDGLKELKNFTWDKIAKETVELYKKVLS